MHKTGYTDWIIFLNYSYFIGIYIYLSLLIVSMQKGCWTKLENFVQQPLSYVSDSTASVPSVTCALLPHGGRQEYQNSYVIPSQ